MNRQTYLLVLTLCGLGATAAHAQVVQLPTFHSFSVATTVSVPDGGAAYLGGVNRGAWSSSSRGVPGLSHLPGVSRLFTNRGIGSSVSSSHAYATATIIDHAEMDRAVLAEAAARRGKFAVASETDLRAAYLSEHIARRGREKIGTGTSQLHEILAKHRHPLGASPIFSQPRSPKATEARSVLAIRAETPDPAARIAAASAKHEAEMLAYVQRAESAEAAGSIGAAKCFYDVLARRGNDEQQQLAARRLAALTAPATDDKLARREH